MKCPSLSRAQRAFAAVLAAALAGCSSEASNAIPAAVPSLASQAPMAGGVPAIGLEAVSPGLTGTASDGFIFPKCAAQEAIEVRAPGAPSATLRSDDPQLRVEKTAVPNRFALVPQGIPDGNSVAHLTATIGARSVHANVTFDGTICGKFTEYTVPTAASAPVIIAAGPDGALWFTEISASKIGRITTAGAFSQTALTPGSKPFGIAAGPDGALWFTENAGNKIGRIATSTRTVTEYGIHTQGSAPNLIALGTDNQSMWFTEGAGNNVGRIGTTTHALNEYKVPTAGAGLYGITTGINGAMYFTELYANKLGTIGSTGAVSEAALSKAPGPLGIASVNGLRWFTENVNNAIGAHLGATNGVFPTPTTGSNPNMIVLGPDGALWFTEGTTGKIGRITNSVKAPIVTEFTIPTANSGPFGITKGADGSIWFTESYSNKIGRLQ